MILHSIVLPYSFFVPSLLTFITVARKMLPESTMGFEVLRTCEEIYLCASSEAITKKSFHGPSNGKLNHHHEQVGGYHEQVDDRVFHLIWLFWVSFLWPSDMCQLHCL